MFLLSHEDHAILLNPTAWLNDNIIHAAQKLLKQHSTAICGFQNTLLGAKCAFKPETEDFVQILFDGRGHWLTVSTVGAKAENVVMVYDSLYKSIGFHVKQQVASLMTSKSNKSELNINIMDIHMQSGTNDCGLFAIANATAIVHGISPGSQAYKQEDMRTHLVKCLIDGKLTPFPLIKRRRCKDHVKSSQRIQLYCICRMPEDPQLNMIECTNCKHWYHIRCVSVSKKAVLNANVDWFCKQCSLS